MRCGVVVLLLLVLSAAAHADPEVASRTGDDRPARQLKVNPYGPTVTNPADLTNVGVPEYEIFNQTAYGGTYGRQRALQVLVKYTFDPRWQVSIGTNGLVQTDEPTGRAFGDPSLNLNTCSSPSPANRPASRSSSPTKHRWARPRRGSTPAAETSA